MDSLRALVVSVEVSTPSMLTVPAVGSYKRSRRPKSVDFPLPVRPQIAIFSPAFISRLTSSRTLWTPNCALSPDMDMAPCVGHAAGGSAEPSCSLGVSPMNCLILVIAPSEVSNSVQNRMT